MHEKRETIEEEPELDKSSVGVTAEREPTIARKEGIPEGGEKMEEKLVISREEKTLEETTKRTRTEPDEEKERLSIVENVQLNGHAASSSSKQTDAQETEESHEAVKVIPKEGNFDPTENITYRSQEDEKERAEALKLIEQSSSDGKDLDRGTSPSLLERTSRDKKTDDERAKQVETGKPASIAYRISYLLLFIILIKYSGKS